MMNRAPSDDEPSARAGQQAVEWTESDPTYAELMWTYVELGELLQDADQGDWYEDDCRVLVDRLIALGRRMDTEIEQAMAAKFARLSIHREAA